MGWGEIRVRVKLELGFNLGYGEIRVRVLLGLRFHISHQHHILAYNYVGDQQYIGNNLFRLETFTDMQGHNTMPSKLLKRVFINDK